MEVLISASILAVGLLGLAMVFPVAYLNVDSGGRQTEATAVAQSIIEQVRTVGATDPANFDDVIGPFLPAPANGFNGMSTANCLGDPFTNWKTASCITWRNTLLNGVQLPQAVGTVTMTCQDGAGNGVPNPSPNDDCTGGSQPTWLATVNVTVNWNDLRGPRTVTLTTRMMRP